jgi:hypothetical protein
LVENHCFSQQNFLELKGSSKITSSSAAAAAAVVTGSLNVIFFLSSKIKGREKRIFLPGSSPIKHCFSSLSDF